MIGYYVHHQGRGHLHRAQALAEALDERVTGLSSLPRPASWTGPWLTLPRDDVRPDPTGVTAGGRLHWVPRHDPGLRARSALLASWLERSRPRLVVVDVSVEVALLVRLHGVPVVTVVLPGRRTDPAHLLGFRVSDALVAFSPLPAAALVPGLPDDVAARVCSVGAISRFPVARPAERRPGPPRAVVLAGQGGPGARGGCPSPVPDEATLRRSAAGWEWSVLGGPGAWVEDPSPALRDADVVVTHAGEGALADVAAQRRPAVVVPDERPFAEQETTAALLAQGDWPAVVLPRVPDDGWPEVLRRAASLDGGGWARWCDGRAAERFAQVVAGTGGDRPTGLRSA